MEVEEKTLEIAESFLKRAHTKLMEAEGYLKSGKYPVSVSASQECIELSTKAMFLLLKGEYPKSHEFDDDELAKLIERVPKDLAYLEFPRVIIFNRFWSSMYTLAKYGHDKLGYGPERLFKRGEAKLAYEHADDCYRMASLLMSRIRWS